MTRQKTLLTSEEFYLFCCQNDGRYELVDGEVVELAPPNDEHGDTALSVGTAFKIYSRRQGVGQARCGDGLHAASRPGHGTRPRRVFRISPPRRGPGQRLPHWARPDVAVEVVSPSDTAAEVAGKVAEYLAAGSQRVWVVYPSVRRVVIHRADCSVLSYSGDDLISDEELLPGFSLPLSEIFE